MKKIGSALFFIVPMSCGATFGYFFRNLGHYIQKIMFAIIMAFALAGLVFTANISGLACGTILVLIFIAPLYIGILLGGLIRSWSINVLTARFQSSPLLVFFLTPILYGAIEEQAFKPTPIRTVQTEVVIKAPQADVWNKLRFYEHVKQKSPLLLRIGMPIPKHAIGNHKQVGEITSCEYEGGGFIRKRITKLVEHQELGFDVIEQSIHFEHDLLLHGGSIRLRPINAGKYTIVTMSTHYESYVRPSWLWEPSIDHVVKTLHQFVIEDIQDELNGNEDDHQIAHQQIQHMALMAS